MVVPADDVYKCNQSNALDLKIPNLQKVMRTEFDMRYHKGVIKYDPLLTDCLLLKTEGLFAFYKDII